MSETGEARSYKAAAITLHWLIAAGIVFQVLWGWYFTDLERGPEKTSAEHLHISIGFTILILTLLRIAIRLINRPPPLPAGMPGWEVFVSKVTHVLFYILMLALPLTGWAMESTGGRSPPFWGASWPSFPIIGAMSREESRPLHGLLETVHGSVLGWSMVVLFGLHVLGALKHQFDGRPVLWRMLPFLRPKTA